MSLAQLGGGAHYLPGRQCHPVPSTQRWNVIHPDPWTLIFISYISLTLPLPGPPTAYTFSQDLTFSAQHHRLVTPDSFPILGPSVANEDRSLGPASGSRFILKQLMAIPGLGNLLSDQGPSLRVEQVLA